MYICIVKYCMSKFLTHTYQNICTGDLVLVRNNEDIQYNSIQTATQSQSHMLVHVFIVYIQNTNINIVSCLCLLVSIKKETFVFVC